jgi:hypothetical protein
VTSSGPSRSTVPTKLPATRRSELHRRSSDSETRNALPSQRTTPFMRSSSQPLTEAKPRLVTLAILAGRRHWRVLVQRQLAGESEKEILYLSYGRSAPLVTASIRLDIAFTCR